MRQNIQQDSWKHSAGGAAAQLIENDMVIGLGTGSTATQLVYALAERIQAGLHIIGAVPTSKVTEDLARNLDIPLTTLDDHPVLDLVLDGADEIDSTLNLIKGAGGALLREKIVASAARRFVVIGDATKLVTLLGTRFALPVEVVPFAITPVQRRLAALSVTTHIRTLGNTDFITDNGNMIVDCTFPNGIPDPLALHTQIKNIVGVVETGLFLHMAERAIIGGPDGVKVLYPSQSNQSSIP